MPYVTCPSCSERGKIPPNLIGTRIKCRKCGVSFQVSPPAAKASATTPAPVAAGAGVVGLAAAVESPQGIEVEGLDSSSWSLSTEPAIGAARAEADAGHAGEAASPFVAAPSSSVGPREYKILTARDKFFDGKFELTRLEDALNHYARQGWVAKALSTPHVKGFSGALEEVIVVLLERCKEGG